MSKQTVKPLGFFGSLMWLLLLFGGTSSPDTVTQTIAYESSGESFEAQAWVANVIRTRAEERKLTPSQVCLQRRQFSCWNKGANLTPRTAGELRTAAKAWQASEAMPRNVNLYHDISVLPWWAKSSKVTFIRRIGRLMFYYE